MDKQTESQKNYAIQYSKDTERQSRAENLIVLILIPVPSFLTYYAPWR